MSLLYIHNYPYLGTGVRGRGGHTWDRSPEFSCLSPPLKAHGCSALVVINVQGWQRGCGACSFVHFYKGDLQPWGKMGTSGNADSSCQTHDVQRLPDGFLSKSFNCLTQQSDTLIL